MESNPEQRHKARFNHQSSISVEELNSDSGARRDAKMYNYNDNGLYFEADFDIKPGTELHIGIDNSPYPSNPDVYENYRATIAWQQKLENSSYSFGYGVQFAEKVDPKIPAEEPSRGDRKHPRKSISVPLKYTSSDQEFQGIIKNISKGGLFIKSDHPIPVGMKLKLSIPSKKKAKLVKLGGKVVRSDPNGFGVEFEEVSVK